MDKRYPYLCHETLAVLCYLLSHTELKIKKFVYTDRLNHDFENDLKQYEHYNFNETLEFVKDGESFTFKLINKQKLVVFLKNYIELYRKNKLISSVCATSICYKDYFNYADNLEFISTKIVQQYKNSPTFTLNSEIFRTNNSLGLGLESRFIEYILDLHFNQYLKIEGIRVVHSKRGFSTELIFFVEIKVTLSKPLNDIKYSLNIQLNKIATKPKKGSLKFSGTPEDLVAAKYGNVRFSDVDFKLPINQYCTLYAIYNNSISETKNLYSSKIGNHRTTVSRINKAFAKIFPDFCLIKKSSCGHYIVDEAT